MASPPSVEGACHETVAWVLPATAVTVSGWPGTVAGTTALDGSEAAPAPIALVATTVNVYEVPLVSPRTVQVKAPDVEHVRLPGELVTA